MRLEGVIGTWKDADACVTVMLMVVLGLGIPVHRRCTSVVGSRSLVAGASDTLPGGTSSHHRSGTEHPR